MDFFGTQRKPTIFDERKKRIADSVALVTDANKLSDTYEQTLNERHAFKLLNLDKEGAKTLTDKVTLRFGQTPSGVPFFTSNQDYYITTCTVPFTGSYELAQRAMRFADEQLIALQQRTVTAKAYNPLAQIDDAKALNQLKQGVNEIEANFNTVNEEAIQFNDELLPFISKTVEARRRILSDISNRNDAMNPFK